MKTKKILCLLLSFIILIGAMSGTVMAQATQISSAEDLPEVIEEGEIYELSADIVLSQGQQITTLAGTLDGKGYTIILADKPLANNVSGTIQNLGVLSGDTPLNLSGCSGSMAVNLTGTIRNCFSLVNMASSGWDDIGGLIGTLDGGSIYNCYHAGSNSAMFADGIIGVATNNGGDIANCFYKTGYSAIGMNESKVTQTNIAKISDFSGIDVVNGLNTEVASTGFRWTQDTENINNGYPILVEDTGEVVVNKFALELRIIEAKELKAETYTEDTWNVLVSALTEAENVFALEAATQDEVNSALSSLENAIAGLEKIKPTEPVSQDDYLNVKHIKTQMELEAIGSGNANTYYVLDNDITFDGWYMGFGAFEGAFDGNGHTITFNKDFTGLFENVGSNGVIQNVHFTGAIKDTAEYGACGLEIRGAVINCYTEVTGAKASGFAKRLKGGIISNCYSKSKAAAGVIISQTETPNGEQYTGTLKNVYWDNSLAQPIDLSNLTLQGEVKGLNTSSMKTKEFATLLNENKGVNGTSWGQNDDGYPYFGEDKEYTPDDNNFELEANKTAIAFTTEREPQTTIIIENQELEINPELAVNKIAGLFSLPEFEPAEGENVEWSIEQETVEGMADIGSAFPYLSISKDGTLVVKATLVKADGSRETLASVKVIIGTNEITDIKIYLAEYDDMQNGTEVIDCKATVPGSADMRILIKALYDGDIAYQTISADNFIIELSDPDNIVKYTENTTTFRFNKPGKATISVTYKDNESITENVEIESVHVPVESIIPGISGTIVIHGRNGNSSDTSAFLPDYANVSVFPSNASYASDYAITTSDKTVGEYVTSMVYGYVPHSAGTVTYTATIKDNENVVSGTSVVEYVYKNPLKNVTIENNELWVNVGENIPSGITFEGILTDGHEITETGIKWNFSEEGIIAISREGGFWKSDESAPDKGNYFLSSEYKIKGLKPGTVTVTGTPFDNTGGAQPITFNVTVQNDGTPAPDIFNIISEGIATSESYITEQITNNEGLSYGFEWYVVSMLRAGKLIDEDVLNDYYQSVLSEIANWDETIKPTDAERVALALAIMGKDITNAEGINVAEFIYNNARLSEGSNELAYALLTLDSVKVEIPEDALWNRESIVNELLKFQSINGGFGLSDAERTDVDITAMCIQALASYSSDENVKYAIEKAVGYLKNTISTDFNFADNVNSTAQVLQALATLKIDITNPDNGFGGEYYNIITALNNYRNPNGNGFLYGNSVNSMATIQVMQAFDAYRKSMKENVVYWDFGTAGKNYEDAELDDDNDINEGAEPVNVYVTIASEGVIVTDKNGIYVAQSPVSVKDIDNDGKLTVDEALYAVHETYYNGGAETGYSSYLGQYGLSLAILWGKGEKNVSAKAGYYLNNASCWSLADEVKEGDYLTAFNYKDTEFWSDAYAYFTDSAVEVEEGKSVILTLNALGYDENWNTVSKPYTGANVKVVGNNNIYENLLTDEKGQVSINFSATSGTEEYYVVAYTEDGLIVPAICKIKVFSGESGNSGGSITSDYISVYIKVSDPKGRTYHNKKLYSLKKGASAYELLKLTGLNVDISESVNGTYVKGIEGLCEFDEGSGSGWMYRVNDKFPEYSAASYALKNGDYVEWLYTRDLGADLGKYYSGNSSSSSGKNKKPKVDKQDEKIKEEQTDDTIKIVFTDNIFSDVKKDNWYYESVKYVYEKGIMNGTGNGFEPGAKMSRAMLVTVLYRIVNPESVAITHNFKDVPEGKWYSEAVAWATSNGIVQGLNDTQFAPDKEISREQMALILYRFAKMQNYDIIDSNDISNYSDASEVSKWALDAVKWANRAGIISGTGVTTLSPKGTATRAQVATVLMRFCENIAK